MLAESATSSTIVVTGALSYTGRYATRRLLDRGHRIRTLTNHPSRENPFGDRVQAFPYSFDSPDRLREILRGASALINTYWVRFPHRGSTFETAVENTRTLIRAAKEAGVGRIVHVSIANPSLDSPLGYYRGKAELERVVMDSGLSYAILRPTVIFGLEDILINNIAWFVRRLPLFGIPGDGRYRIRPIYVEDMAQLMADATSEGQASLINAIGPESFSFEELVRLIADRVGRSVHLVHLPVPLAYLFTRATGWLVRDVVLTWEEYKGLTANLLAPEGPATGHVRLTEWLTANRERVGARYASEVARHFGGGPR